MRRLDTFTDKIRKSPFSNVYWFARAFTNTDLYGSIGKEEKIMEIILQVEDILSSSVFNEEQKFELSKNKLRELIGDISKEGTKKHSQHLNFINMLDDTLNNNDDIAVLCLTMRYIVAPINRAMNRIPSSDNEYCEASVKDILNLYGEKSAGLAIARWDELGIRGCLEAERDCIIDEFDKLLDNMNEIQIPHGKLEDNMIMTAFVQEFERRLGQKRKTRGGHSLETVTGFLFDYYNFKASTKPEHFDQNIEVDKWFRCKDGWSIGISCKRTLRERWKQLASAGSTDLSHFKIKEIWHIITFDKDLSDDKIVNLGRQRHIFYLNENGDVYKKCSTHIGMMDYVRPLSQLIDDIRREIK